MDREQFQSELRALPKSDLHVHFEGSVSWETLNELARRHGVNLTAPVRIGEGQVSPPPAITLGRPSFRNFQDFIGYYLKISETIRTADDCVTVGHHYLEQARAQSISATDMYFTPTTFAQLGHDLPNLFQGLLAAQQLATTKYGMTINWIFDIVRNGKETGEETLEYALTARQMGVKLKAIGLAGDERARPANVFRDAFARARKHGFETLAHCGETLGVESIRDTISCLQPSRIGHGLHVLTDERLVDQVKRESIIIEVAPWSNILLGISTPATHPLREMITAGLPVVISADDPGIFGKDLVENYLFAVDQGIPLPELREVAKRSLEHSLC